MELLVFMGWVISYAKEWEEYSNYFGEGVGTSEIRPLPTFWPFMVSLRAATVPVGLSFS